jgi:hypothetical protein
MCRRGSVLYIHLISSFLPCGPGVRETVLVDGIYSHPNFVRVMSHVEYTSLGYFYDVLLITAAASVLYHKVRNYVLKPTKKIPNDVYHNSFLAPCCNNQLRNFGLSA